MIAAQSQTGFREVHNDPIPAMCIGKLCQDHTDYIAQGLEIIVKHSSTPFRPEHNDRTELQNVDKERQERGNG